MERRNILVCDQKKKVKKTYSYTSPSRFPPSPIVMWTGADWSLTGSHKPLLMLYAMLDILSCINIIKHAHSVTAATPKRKRVHDWWVGCVTKSVVCDGKHGIIMILTDLS